MFKKHGKIILIIVLVFQLLIPFVFLIFQGNLNKTIDDTPANVRLKINSIDIYEEDLSIYADVYSIHPLTVGIDNYLIFDERTEDYSVYYTSQKKPDHERYLTFRKIYDLSYITVPLPEKYKDLDWDYWSIYNRENEEANIKHKECEGPATEAYVDLVVYKGNFVFKDACIDGVSLNEYLESIENGDVDVSRYDFNFFNDDFDYDAYYDLYEDSKKVEDYVIENP